ncbi:MAG: aminoacyl-tRNA hydrolase [Sedimentisphaerales bacterium]|nr:aminoacyl-tRNA hydrolase [Sedimentisphaerales bacterium]
MLKINEKISISEQYITINYVRSRGPGGQNVNKVNTRAQLSFDLENCPELNTAVKKRLKKLPGSKVTDDNRLIIQSDCYRLQNRNRQECLDRLRKFISKALVVPKKRRPTKPTQASKHKRLADKKHRSSIKSLRSKVTPQE